MAQYKIYAGLGGGFGGGTYQGTYECDSESDAYEIAYDLSCEEYESYAGLHGLADYQDIVENPEDYGLEEGESDEDILWDAYSEERGRWLDYWVEQIS